MKLRKYIKDKWVTIIISFFFLLITISFLIAFKVSLELIIALTITFILFIIIIFIYNFYRKKHYYDVFLNNLDRLDQKYLISELIKKPNFYEGEILYESIYEIDKSMTEIVSEYKQSVKDFKEFIELWIHEVKIPLASLSLIVHNNKSAVNKKIKEQINHLEDYTEQILYYVRSENPEKDYLIKKCSLDEIVKNVALKNQDNFRYKHTDFIVSDLDKTILTDSKWLEFIINQIVSNSLKYQRENPYIKITALEKKDEIQLIIFDNGKGISSSDLPRVFEKSFTGENGRDTSKSTGMGLYICYNLCQKLGHTIKIESVKDKFTKVTISFAKDTLV